MEEEKRNLVGLTPDHRARLAEARSFLNSPDGQKANSNGVVNTTHAVTHLHPIDGSIQRRVAGYPSVDSTTKK